MSTTPHNLETFAQRLVAARKAAGFTQQQVADHLGLSRPSFIAVEKGVRRPPLDEVKKIAAFIGCQVSDLLDPGLPVTLEPRNREAMDRLEGMAPKIGPIVSALERFVDDYASLEQKLSQPLPQSPHAIEQLPRIGGPAQLMAVAEDLAARERARLQLGEQPIHRLSDLLEDRAGIRVCEGPMPDRIAAIYAYLPDLGSVTMANLKHPQARRRMTLAMLLGRSMTEDRKRPDVVHVHTLRKSVNDRFAYAFAMAFLMPAAVVRRHVHEVVHRSDDFQVADLLRAASFFEVLPQAMNERLEHLALLPAGTSEGLKTLALKVRGAPQQSGDAGVKGNAQVEVSARFRRLAVQAFHQNLIDEAELTRLLRVDTSQARKLAQREQDVTAMTDGGLVEQIRLPTNRSLLGGTP